MIYPYYPQLTDNETLVVPIDFFIQILNSFSSFPRKTTFRLLLEFSLKVHISGYNTQQPDF